MKTFLAALLGMCAFAWFLYRPFGGDGQPQIQAQVPSTNLAESASKRVYDGNWWLSASTQEQLGFVDGSIDCLVYVAQAKWVSRDVDHPEDLIGQYYKTHPTDRNTLVINVWQKLLPTAPLAAPRPPGGEVYTNPHGYYDGLYWRQLSESKSLSFLEGYISCMTRDVDPSRREMYSEPVSFYHEKIWDYVVKNVASDNEAIATMLSRYRDN